jgi:hypothetical protein
VRRLFDFGLALGAGTALWLVANAIDGVREPWDGASFWSFYLAALALSAVLGLFASGRAWALGAAVVFTMLPVMLAGSGTGPLLAVGAVFLAIMALPAAGVAEFAFGLRRRFSGQSPQD